MLQALDSLRAPCTSIRAMASGGSCCLRVPRNTSSGILCRRTACPKLKMNAATGLGTTTPGPELVPIDDLLEVADSFHDIAEVNQVGLEAVFVDRMRAQMVHRILRTEGQRVDTPEFSWLHPPP
jgi:hypothetical protein